MFIELLAHDDYLRVLNALERKGLRFTEVQRSLKLNPARVDRAITFLKKARLIVPETIPAEKGPILVRYRLARRGSIFLKAFGSFVETLRSKPEFGDSEVADFHHLTK